MTDEISTGKLDTGTADDRIRWLLLSASDEFLHAIGLIASQWAIMESVLDQAIWKALGVPWDQGRAVTTHLAVRARQDLLRALFDLQQRDTGQLDEIDGELARLNVIRNRVVHAPILDLPSPFGQRGKVAGFTWFSARGKLKDKTEFMSLDALREAAAGIARLTLLIMDLHEREWPQSSRQLAID